MYQTRFGEPVLKMNFKSNWITIQTCQLPWNGHERLLMQGGRSLELHSLMHWKTQSWTLTIGTYNQEHCPTGHQMGVPRYGNQATLIMANFNTTSAVKWANILVGADYRLFEVIPDGNTFVDFSRQVSERTKAGKDGRFGKNQYYTKYGAFGQITKLLFDDKLKLSASARLDHNPWV